MIQIKSFSEDIHGNMATVYHRTSVSNLINAIYTEGFKPGSGDMYGKGFYSTYRLDSQEKSNMSNTYGNIVVKFAVQVRDFFFFDFEEFKKISLYKTLKSSEETFIQDQIAYYKINVKNFNPNLRPRYTSETALWMYNNTDLYNKVKGIVFTGSRDGAVVVAYDTELIYPLAYKMDGEKNFSKVEKNREYMKKVLNQKLQVFTPGKSSKRKLLLDYDRFTVTGEETVYAIEDTDKVKGSYMSLSLYELLNEKEFSWLLDCSFKDARLTLDKLSTLVFQNGEFIDGTWEYGTFKKASWKNGIWKNGIFSNSIWESGSWEDGHFLSSLWMDGVFYSGYFTDSKWNLGVFKNGVFSKSNWLTGLWKEGTFVNSTWKSGTWTQGTFHKQSVWENGVWMKGYFRDSIWRKGRWLKGNFIHSVWDEGFWTDGTFDRSKWKNGEWENGTFEDSEWHKGTWDTGNWSNSTWFNGVWKNGIWDSGEWKNGVWENGLWKEGKWLDGSWKDGDWVNGTWTKGTWNKGTWQDGIWEDGKWLDGTWEDGIWKKGTWVKGVWEDFGNPPSN